MSLRSDSETVGYFTFTNYLIFVGFLAGLRTRPAFCSFLLFSSFFPYGYCKGEVPGPLIPSQGGFASGFLGRSPGGSLRLPLRGGPGALLEAAFWKKLLVVRTFTLPPISLCKSKCTLNTFWRRSRGGRYSKWCSEICRRERVPDATCNSN